MKKILLISAICLMIDQILKYIVVSCLELYQGITIIPKFFSIFYVQNTGAAWSILEGGRLFLIGASIVALSIIYFMFIKNKKLTNIETVTYGILIGGVVGNLIDRIFRGYVIDYLKFDIFYYRFPVFNFADICIVLSVLFIFILLVKGEKDERDKVSK